MSMTETPLPSAQFLVDPAGNKKAVVLAVAIWQELLDWLEDLAVSNF